MIVTDASIWVSTMRYNEIHHQTTRIWIDKYIATGQKISAPTLIVAEVSGALARRTGRSRLGHIARHELSAYSFLQLISVDFHLASIASELAADCQLCGADAVYAALAYSLGVPLLTWDQEQITRVQKMIKAGTPGTSFGSNGQSNSPS